MKKLLPIFLLITISIGTMVEARAFHLDEDTVESFTQLSDSTVEQEHDECQENHCHEEEGHCSHHCSGIHNFAKQSNTIYLNPNFSIKSKATWSYYIHYKKPALDPELRPPSHS
ncbi:MAG: hypothetical protein KC493_13610 [Bacteriovoracaceae bacterium]|nr:hypothetical protein [Bacteriovoracaceae bacterium]